MAKGEKLARLPQYTTFCKQYIIYRASQEYNCFIVTQFTARPKQTFDSSGHVFVNFNNFAGFCKLNPLGLKVHSPRNLKNTKPCVIIPCLPHEMRERSRIGQQ